MRQLSARERRLVAIGILVALIALVWLGAISPVLGGFLDRQEERETLHAQYARNARIVSSIPLWKHQMMAQQRSLREYAIVAPAEQIAAAQLKQRLAQSVNGVGGLLSGSSILDSAAGTIKVRGEASLTMQQLYQLLRRLQSEQPYVVVEHLSVVADRALEAGHLAPMAVKLDVAASYRATEPQ
jgi:general secretion pathway protein M